jgi:hypothetical protein
MRRTWGSCLRRVTARDCFSARAWRVAARATVVPCRISIPTNTKDATTAMNPSFSRIALPDFDSTTEHNAPSPGAMNRPGARCDAPGRMELRLPSAILARLGGQQQDRFAAVQSDASARTSGSTPRQNTTHKAPELRPGAWCDAPGRIRTCDLRIRSPLLYPAELRAPETRALGPRRKKKT